VKMPSFESRLAALIITLFVVFYLWQTPPLWQSPLSVEEIQSYALALEKQLDQPSEDRTDFINQLGRWASQDDGQPVLMVNLIRFRAETGEALQRRGFTGTPAEANSYYEAQVAPLALKRGEYPLLGGDTQVTSLVNSGKGQTGIAWWLCAHRVAEHFSTLWQIPRTVRPFLTKLQPRTLC